MIRARQVARVIRILFETMCDQEVVLSTSRVKGDGDSRRRRSEIETGIPWSCRRDELHLHFRVLPSNLHVSLKCHAYMCLPGSGPGLQRLSIIHFVLAEICDFVLTVSLIRRGRAQSRQEDNDVFRSMEEPWTKRKNRAEARACPSDGSPRISATRKVKGLAISKLPACERGCDEIEKPDWNVQQPKLTSPNHRHLLGCTPERRLSHSRPPWTSGPSSPTT